MTAQFVATALNYCMWRGSIKILGRRRRPWLVLQRTELEYDYLQHQLTQLRRSYPGKLEVDQQPIPGDGFYDEYRIMVHCPELARVYELLYPRDKKFLSPTILQIVGAQAMASLWCDQGRSDGKRLSFLRIRPWTSVKRAIQLLEERGYDASCYRQCDRGGLAMTLEASQKLARELYQEVHVSMRRGLVRGTR